MPSQHKHAKRNRRDVLTRWAYKHPKSSYSYDLALLEQGYGRAQMLGDLFGDMMGAVIGKDNWDARPDWMKAIKVNPDPVKIAKTAASIVAPKEVGRVVDQASKYGIDLAYKTQFGHVPITGGMVASGYHNVPMIASLSRGAASVPVWVYIGGAVLVVGLIVASKK